MARLAQFKPTDPFQAWLDSLDKIRNQLGGLGVQVAPTAPGGAVTQQPVVPSVVPQGQSGFIAPSITQDVLDDVFGRGAVQAPATININVTGTGDLSDDTKKKIVDTIIDDTVLEAAQNLINDGQPRKQAAPAEGGNLLAILIDIKKAYLALDVKDKDILIKRYHENLTLQELAQYLECSVSTADRKSTGALRRLQNNLGGESPWQ